MTHFFLILIIFFAVFTQSLTGFGVALISMALLPELVGIKVATPLVALVGITLELALLFRYRTAFNLKAVWPAAVASVPGITFGIWLLRQVDASLLLTLLGMLITGYAIYALLEFRLPKLEHPVWAYGFGFLAGLLGGAYNTSGPPIIIYANCRRWLPAEFKSNLQGFFLFNSVVVVAGHALSHNFTHPVWSDFLLSLPAIGIGIIVGTRLDKYLNPTTFRKAVLWLLVIVGLRLVLP